MSSTLSRCATRQPEEAVVVVKAAEEKAVQDAERGTSVPQPKMTQTSNKVAKDLRMDLLLDAEVTRTIKRADWYAFGQL